MNDMLLYEGDDDSDDCDGQMIASGDHFAEELLRSLTLQSRALPHYA